MTPTVDQIMALNPCKRYTRERVEELLARGWSVDTLCSLPPEDVRWVLSHLMSESQARLWARRCALSVIHLWNAPEVVRRYLESGDESLRDAAEAAAAAWAAAWAWARAGAAAAWAAAGAAAGDAVRAAVRAAAEAAADAVAHRRCVEMALEILEGEP